jgi:hypothetical protein
MADPDAIWKELVALVKTRDWHSPDAQSPISDVELDAVERELRIPLPPSYRSFVKRCGSGRVGLVDVFGLPRNRLWGDVVLMNQLAEGDKPGAYLKFATDWTGRSYYFDTSGDLRDSEWPVVVLGPDDLPRRVAGSFLDFMGRLVQGPITVELTRRTNSI